MTSPRKELRLHVSVYFQFMIYIAEICVSWSIYNDVWIFNKLVSVLVFFQLTVVTYFLLKCWWIFDLKWLKFFINVLWIENWFFVNSFAGVVLEQQPYNNMGSDGESEDVSGTSEETFSPLPTINVKLRQKSRSYSKVSGDGRYFFSSLLRPGNLQCRSISRGGPTCIHISFGTSCNKKKKVLRRNAGASLCWIIHIRESFVRNFVSFFFLHPHPPLSYDQ